MFYLIEKCRFMKKALEEKSALVARLAVDRERLNRALIQLEKPFEKVFYFFRGARLPPTTSIKNSFVRRFITKAPQAVKWPIKIWRGFRAVRHLKHSHP
jgi:hypothetical protein